MYDSQEASVGSEGSAGECVREGVGLFEKPLVGMAEVLALTFGKL